MTTTPHAGAATVGTTSASDIRSSICRLVADVQAKPSPAPAATPDPNAHDATTLRIAEHDRLGGVRLAGVIGAGGMGTVYLGRHEILDIDVAVKVMKEVANPERFLKEARLAAKVQHDCIVRVLHAGREKDRLFLVMELVQGANLKQLLMRHGRLPWPVAAALAAEAARGLGAAHRGGIVHRDVKPSNLIATIDGRVKVADLGLAREAHGRDDQTETGIIVGTPAYMAPEQARESAAAGPRADVYSLGATLFHLVAGEPPFKRSSQTSVLLAHLNEAPPDPRSFAKDVPAPLADLVARMLAKDPLRRPADGDAVAEELEALIGGSTPGTAFVDRQRGLRRRPLAAAAAVSCSLIAASLLIWPGRQLGRPATDAAAVAGPPAAAPVADPWQTAERAVFLLADGVDGETASALYAGLAGTGLRVVERARIDAIVAELDRSRDGRLAPETMQRLGRLVGGHIAVIAELSGAKVHLRAAPVETGEIAGDRMPLPAAAAAEAAELVAAAVALLPAQGVVSRAGDATWLSLGRRHGVRVGQRFAVLDAAGKTLANAEVLTVEATRCNVRCDGPCPDGARARSADAP